LGLQGKIFSARCARNKKKMFASQISKINVSLDKFTIKTVKFP